MAKKTCAACDCELDANSIKVKIGGNTIEVCCDECARKLNEAPAYFSSGDGQDMGGNKIVVSVNDERLRQGAPTPSKSL
jgi:ribosome-binding protein aMBF1 (putative translation factor)